MIYLDWLDLEVERDQRENERLEILDEVVEDAESLWVGGLAHVNERSDLCSLQAP